MTTPSGNPDDNRSDNRGDNGDNGRIVLGYARNRLKPRTTPAGQKLHRASQDADSSGMLLYCDTGHGLRILTPAATLPVPAIPADELAPALIAALHELDLPTHRLCLRCFDDIRPTYWEQRTARHRRTVTVSAHAAALIARAVALPRLTPQPSNTDTTTPVTVTLTGHADAVIAGLVAPLGLRVRHGGINASAQTWAEIRAAFPLSRYTDFAEHHDVDSMKVGAVWTEVRTAFPPSAFADWADLAERFIARIDHFYNPDAGH